MRRIAKYGLAHFQGEQVRGHDTVGLGLVGYGDPVSRKVLRTAGEKVGVALLVATASAQYDHELLPAMERGQRPTSHALQIERESVFTSLLSTHHLEFA